MQKREVSLGIDDDDQVVGAGEAAVDEDAHGAAAVLDEVARLIVDERSGREEFLHSSTTEDGEERLTDAACLNVGRQVAHGDAGTHEQEVERLVVDQTHDRIAGVVGDFVAGGDA